MIQIGTLPPVITEVETETTDRHGNVLPTIIISPEAPDHNWKSYDYADAFLAAMIDPDNYADDIHALCDALGAAQTLSKFLWLAPYVGGNAADHSLNLRYPYAKGGQKAVYVGSPTHSGSGIEYIQGGPGIYGLCGISASMLDSANFSMGFFSLDTTIYTTAVIETLMHGSVGDNSFWLSTHGSIGGACAWANSNYGGKMTFTPTDGKGQFDCVMSGSRRAVFRNGSKLVESTSTLGFSPTPYDSFRFLLSDRRIGMHYIAEHFTDTEIADNLDIFETFHDARGRL